MAKFKVGDLVQCKKSAPYRYWMTNKDMAKARVIKTDVRWLNEDGHIIIKILEHKDSTFIGLELTVLPEYFTKYRKDESKCI